MLCIPPSPTSLCPPFPLLPQAAAEIEQGQEATTCYLGDLVQVRGSFGGPTCRSTLGPGEMGQHPSRQD